MSLRPIAALVVLSALCAWSPPLVQSPRHPAAAPLPAGLQITLQDPLCPLNGTITATVTLPAPAPAGGTIVTLGSLAPGVATITPGSVTIPAGQVTSTVGQITISGISNGSATLTADAVGCPQATVTVTVTDQFISLGLNVATIPGQTTGLPLSLSIPAPAGGVTINLTTADPMIATVQGSVFIPAGQQIPAANPQVMGVAIGTVSITASASNFAPDSRDVTVASNVMSYSPSTITVAEGFTVTADLDLAVSAPAGGQTVTLTTDHPGIATVPMNVTVAQGENSIPFVVTGILSGTTTVRANAPGLPEATATISVVPPTITLSGTTVGDDLQVPRSAYLNAPAPAGNLDITITSSDPARLLVSTSSTVMGTGSVVVTAGAGSTSVPTFYVQALDDSGSASVTLTAPGWNTTVTSFTFAPSGFRIWSPSQISAAAGGTDRTVSLRSTRLDPATLAPTTWQHVRGGLSVSVPISSSDPAVGVMTIDPVVFLGGDLANSSAFDPIAVGTATVSIGTPAGFDTPSTSQSISATVSPQAIVINGGVVGDDLQTTSSGWLDPAAPAGNVMVTLTSADPSRLLLSTSPTVSGSASITVQVNAGSSSLPTFYVQGLDESGLIQVTATASGYGSGFADFQLTPSGFRIWSPSSFSLSTGVAPASMSIRPCRLDPVTLNIQGSQHLRGGYSASVGVLSSDTNVGTITTSPVVFLGGDLSQSTQFTPLAAGQSTVSIVQPGGFQVPSSGTSILANVFDQNIIASAVQVGDDLQTTTNAWLSAPAPAGNLTVTATSADPSRVLLSDSATTAGSPSISLFVSAGSSSVPSFYVQGLDDNGTVDVTLSAPGYASETLPVTLYPSGFRIWSPTVINTSTFSPPSNINLRSVRLTPGTLATAAPQAVRAGISVAVDVTSSDTNVGQITTSPVIFNGGDISQSTSFDPLVSGSSTISLTTPAGFDTPSSGTSIPAMVDAPDITISGGTVGEHLQVGRTIYLQSAPPGPVDVTVTVNDPSIAAITTDPLVLGTGSITFFGVTGSTVGTIYVQGLLQGSTTVVAQAAGYDDGMATFDVDPSGFRLWSPGAIDTTIYSAPSAVSMRPCVLDPATLNVSSSQRVRGGLTVSLPIMTLDPAIGTMTVDPVVFGPNTISNTSAFQPTGVGNTTIQIGTPPGFTTPSNAQSINALVRVPNITMSSITVGEDLQASTYVYLEAAPPTPIDLAVTVLDPSVAIVSKSATSVGGPAASFPLNTATSVGPIWIQGLSVGTTTVEVSASGYVLASATITVNPSGFRIWSPSAINTSTFSNPSNVTVRSTMLDPTTLNVTASQPIRGGFKAQVPITSSDPSVGTITSVLRFGGNTLSQTATFTPIGAGTTTIALGTSPGFHTPSNGQQITATVTAPTISFSNVTVGDDLQVANHIYLQAAPPTPTNVTVTVANPAMAAISLSATSAGAASQTITGVTTTVIGPIHVQGLQQGMTTVTISASGYAPQVASITIRPSAFRIWSPSSITTTVSASGSSIHLRPCMLDPVTLNVSSSQQLRGGATASVVVSSSDPLVGTISTSPVVFSGGDLQLSTTFQPAGAGSCTVSLTQPAAFDPPSNGFQINATVNP